MSVRCFTPRGRHRSQPDSLWSLGGLWGPQPAPAPFPRVVVGSATLQPLGGVPSIPGDCVDMSISGDVHLLGKREMPSHKRF